MRGCALNLLAYPIHTGGSQTVVNTQIDLCDMQKQRDFFLA